MHTRAPIRLVSANRSPAIVSGARRGLAGYTRVVPGDKIATAAIELQGVHRSFGAVRAVDGIDLRLELGEIAALLGPNGAGKTTTIDIVAARRTRRSTGRPVTTTPDRNELGAQSGPVVARISAN
jgi:ABC-type uncharacterized transport system ATPase subunit